MPRQPVRLAGGIPGEPDPLAVEGEVGLAVVEVVFEAAADEEAAVGGHGDVALVEEAVDVGAQEEAVVETVLASFLHRKDVRGVQGREGLLPRHGAAPAVVVQGQELEGALAQAPPGQDGITPHRGLFLPAARGSGRRSRRPRCSSGDGGA